MFTVHAYDHRDSYIKSFTSFELNGLPAFASWSKNAPRVEVTRFDPDASENVVIAEFEYIQFQINYLLSDEVIARVIETLIRDRFEGHRIS